jgi:hypothetical protein
MTNPTQKFAKQFPGAAVRVVTLALFLAVFGASAALAQTKGGVTKSRGNTVWARNAATNTVTAPDDQVPFTATGTATVTGVTQLPGGLTQINVSTSGSATHLGNFTGPLTRLQDHQGNFGSTAVIVGANGTDSVFFSVNGRFEKSGKCVLISTGTYTVTGGAGAFAGATGSGTISTQTDLCANTATGTYTGTISRPNSN